MSRIFHAASDYVVLFLQNNHLPSSGLSSNTVPAVPPDASTDQGASSTGEKEDTISYTIQISMQ